MKKRPLVNKVKKKGLLGIGTSANANVIKIRNIGQPDVYVPVMDSNNSSNLTLAGQMSVKNGITATSGDLTIAAASGSNVVINSTFKTTGSLVYNVRTVSTTGSLTSTDFVVIATASITLTLPSQTSGRFLEIKRNTIAGFVTITPSTGMIDGGSNYVLTANYQSASLVSDGTNWWVL